MTASVAFTDLNGLRRLQADTPENLAASARQFESLFIDMMLKAARAATAVLADDNPFNSSETQTHQEMLDHQLAVSMADQGGIGLAPILIRQLSKVAGHGAVPSGDGTNDSVNPLEVARSLVQRAVASLHDAPGAELVVGGAPASGASTVPSASTPVVHGALDAARAVMGAPLALATKVVAPANRTDKPRLEQPLNAASLRPLARVQQDETSLGPVAFVQKVLPIVQQVTAGTPLHPLAVLAQAALETGWGKRTITTADGRDSHNLFGIKAQGNWQGEAARVHTLEVRNGVAQRELADFRVYGSMEQSVRDLVALLSNSTRYEDVVHNGNTPEGYAAAIGASGYATDPSYTAKLLRIMRSPSMQLALQALQRQAAVPIPPLAPSDATIGPTATAPAPTPVVPPAAPTDGQHRTGEEAR